MTLSKVSRIMVLYTGVQYGLKPSNTSIKLGEYDDGACHGLNLAHNRCDHSDTAAQALTKSAVLIAVSLIRPRCGYHTNESSSDGSAPQVNESSPL